LLFDQCEPRLKRSDSDHQTVANTADGELRLIPRRTIGKELPQMTITDSTGQIASGWQINNQRRKFVRGLHGHSVRQ
jgi:hypothetical protein